MQLDFTDTISIHDRGAFLAVLTILYYTQLYGTNGQEDG